MQQGLRIFLICELGKSRELRSPPTSPPGAHTRYFIWACASPGGVRWERLRVESPQSRTCEVLAFVWSQNAVNSMIQCIPLSPGSRPADAIWVALRSTLGSVCCQQKCYSPQSCESSECCTHLKQGRGDRHIDVGIPSCKTITQAGSIAQALDHLGSAAVRGGASVRIMAQQPPLEPQVAR